MTLASQAASAVNSRMRRASDRADISLRPRRRRATQWDVREYPFGVPIPPPGALVNPDRVPSPAPPTPPRALQSQAQRPHAPAILAPPTNHEAPAQTDSTNRIVGPPRPGQSGPLAGIDIAALRILLCPKGFALPLNSNSGLVAQAHRSLVVTNAGGTLIAAGPLEHKGSQTEQQLATQPPLGSPQHATRHARRLYVGNLPVNTSDVEVGDFFNRALIHAKGVESPGNPVISVYLNLDKRFAFIELRSLREAAAALAMDGVLFRSMSLRMRRPNDYNEAACPPVAPPDGFDPSLLGIVSTQVGDGPNKVFIGGIPYGLNEDTIKDLLQTYGRLAAFNLIKDPTTGMSKGFAFFEYADPSVVDLACASLSGTTISDKVLTVRRATQQGSQASIAGSTGMIVGEGNLSASQSVPLPGHIFDGTGIGGSSGLPASALVRQSSRILELRNVVTENELKDDEEYAEVVEETEEEARRFGNLEKIVVPRPGPEGAPDVRGVGRVFLVFEKQQDAERAFAFMDGRKFEDRRVEAAYIAEQKFANEDY